MPRETKKYLEELVDRQVRFIVEKDARIRDQELSLNEQRRVISEVQAKLRIAEAQIINNPDLAELKEKLRLTEHSLAEVRNIHARLQIQFDTVARMVAAAADRY